MVKKIIIILIMMITFCCLTSATFAAKSNEEVAQDILKQFNTIDTTVPTTNTQNNSKSKVTIPEPEAVTGNTYSDVNKTVKTTLNTIKYVGLLFIFTIIKFFI